MQTSRACSGVIFKTADRFGNRGAQKRGSFMPFYEFYCPDCNVIFNFFSRRVNTETIPDCPRCRARKLERRISLFAVTGRATKSGGEDSDGHRRDDLPIDEAKMTKAMESLAGEAEHLSEDDPRQAANLMRKFSDMTGLHYTDKMNEALSRLETGEDPEAIEAEMGDTLENEDPFVLPEKKETAKTGAFRKAQPTRDETVYEL
jgi:putative FmdB family regulatory protein